MSKITASSRLVVLCALVALLASAITATSASAANPFLSPAFKVCKKVPASVKEQGLYSDSHCLANVVKGEYAWSTPAGGGAETWYCLLNASGKYQDGLCQVAGAGKFLPTGFTETFPTVLGSGGTSTLKGTVSTKKSTISCTNSTFKGQPQTGSLVGNVTITYTGCTVTEPAGEGCKVNSVGKPVETIETTELMGTALSAKLVDFNPQAAGAAFTTLEFTGTGCPLNGAGKAEVTGSQMCTYAAGIEEAAEEHELECNGSESTLKLNGSKAEYTGKSRIMVTGGPLWKIR